MCYNFMQTIIGTLQVYKRLKKANLHDEAAREIAEIFKDLLDGNTKNGTRHGKSTTCCGI